MSSVFDGSARTKAQYQDDLNATPCNDMPKLLRAGGNFALAAQPVYKHEPLLEEQWEARIFDDSARKFPTTTTAVPDRHRRRCWPAPPLAALLPTVHCCSHK
nr:probable methyltransferase PMT11 [Tanacetum cinerariifolium]